MKLRDFRKIRLNSVSQQVLAVLGIAELAGVQAKSQRRRAGLNSGVFSGLRRLLPGASAMGILLLVAMIWPPVLVAQHRAANHAVAPHSGSTVPTPVYHSTVNTPPVHTPFIPSSSPTVVGPLHTSRTYAPPVHSEPGFSAPSYAAHLGVPRGNLSAMQMAPGYAMPIHAMPGHTMSGYAVPLHAANAHPGPTFQTGTYPSTASSLSTYSPRSHQHGSRTGSNSNQALPGNYALSGTGVIWGTQPSFGFSYLNNNPPLAGVGMPYSDGGVWLDAQPVSYPQAYALMSVASSPIASSSVNSARLAIPPRPAADREALAPEPDASPSVSPAILHRNLKDLLTRTLAERDTVPHTGQWLTNHKYHPQWGYRQSVNWAWGVAGYAALDEWLGSNWQLAAEPVIYYTADQVMPPYAVAVYGADECLKLGNQSLRGSDEWIPLGVFGLLPPGSVSYAASIQLAVNQNGEVKGYAIDSATRSIREVTGRMDRSTRRLVWTFPGDGANKFETSAANLFAGESLVNVYSPASGAMAAWQLIRDVPGDVK